MADASRYSSDLLSIPGVAFDVKISDPAERIRAYIRGYASPASADGQDAMDDKLMRDQITLVSVSSCEEETMAIFLVKGGSNLSNRLGNLHGGAISLIYDMCTTMCAAPLAREGFWEFGGVSQNLSVTFLRPAKANRQILVKCQVLKIGKRLATIRGEMRDKINGTLLSVAEHTKATVSFVSSKAAL
ncbi:unnamed protein product [Clonostachys rhizophaga]|uniref:Thioesterase domain-containing protein n=1 Tax=Clonostachys rhizophaga TaxID=160324 RepID=A0A9N9YXI0_9HYPO|nr:unnamed protein product [Clonostachys rhizophaga]